MPQSLAQIYVHIVYSTKHRQPWLGDDDMRSQLYAYMATILRDNVDSPRYSSTASKTTFMLWFASAARPR